jgi:multiple sugar transport system permease protein
VSSVFRSDRVHASTIGGRRPASRSWRIFRGGYGYVFVAPFFIAFAIFQLYPILYSLYLSFTDWGGIGTPHLVGLANYTRLFGDYLFIQSIKNTFIIWLISIIPQLTLALALALILNEKYIRGKHFFRAVFYFPNIVTPVSIGVLFSLLFDWQTGAVNRVLMALHLIGAPIDWFGSPTLSRILVASVMCWQWFGYNMLLFIAGLQSISEDILEAARVDGATPRQVALRISIPLLRPVIVFTIITSIIGGMQIFDVPFVMSGTGPQNSTLTIVMYLYNTAFQIFHYGYAATIAYATFIIIAVLSIVTFRLSRTRGD